MTQISYARDKENTLSFKNVMTKKETKGYKILKLETQATGIHITAAEGKICFLPYEEFIADWIKEGRCRGEGYIAKAYDKEVVKIKEFFSNARNYQISCSLRDEKVVGYSFLGIL